MCKSWYTLNQPALRLPALLLVDCFQARWFRLDQARTTRLALADGFLKTVASQRASKEPTISEHCIAVLHSQAALEIRFTSVESRSMRRKDAQSLQQSTSSMVTFWRAGGI